MRTFLSFLLCLLATVAHADPLVIADSLISEGNRAYEFSQCTRIKECADSISSLLSSTHLHENDAVDLQASAYKLYGNYHYEKGDLDSAETYYNKARILTETHPYVSFKSLTKLLLLRDLAQLHYLRQEYSRAASLMEEVDDVIEYQLPYEVGSDNWLVTKLTYAICLSRINDFDQAVDIARTELENATDKSSLSYAKAQRMYAKILMLADADKNGALNAYKAYFNTQKNFALQNFAKMNGLQRKEYWQSLRPFIADCYQLEESDPAFLYDIALFSKGLLLQLSTLSGDNPPSPTALKSLTFRWTDIQKRLKPGQCAIEFVEYHKANELRMGALLLRASGRPVFIPLTNPDKINAIAGSALQSTDRSDKDRLYEDAALHSSVWTDNLLKALAGCRRIYFAPDGYMHKLAIEYMPPVADRELYRLTSTRRLMETPPSLSASSSMLLMGGINYDLDKAPGASSYNDATAYANYIGSSFPRLSEDSNEAKTIFELRHNSADTMAVASKASENVFRQKAPEFESILISTHGDFCSTSPASTDIKTVDDEITMSQNIMAFAGVNSYLHTPGFNPSDHYDGLLSAHEMAGIDLSRCKLFTISACQSGLGKISPDGVFGLQRGLKNAGVHAMLLSLWNVNSDATARLMTTFYTNLSKGMELREAFSQARRALISDQPVDMPTVTEYIFDPATMSTIPVKKPATTTYNTPQYTNAFILIDALN